MMMARHHHRTDPGTAERLATGRLEPDDTPPGYRRVAALLTTAGTAPGSRGAAGVTDIAAMAAAISEVHTATPNFPRRKTPVLHNIALAKALAVLASLTLPATAAAAATGHLPASLQDKVANAVEHVGVNIPGGDADAADQAEGTNHGAEISDLAETTTATGADKGATISDAANGDHGRTEDHGAPDSNPAGIDTPNNGGPDTAPAADQANGGAAGSDNADEHPTADLPPAAEEHPTAESHPGGRS